MKKHEFAKIEIEPWLRQRGDAKPSWYARGRVQWPDGRLEEVYQKLDVKWYEPEERAYEAVQRLREKLAARGIIKPEDADNVWAGVNAYMKRPGGPGGRGTQHIMKKFAEAFGTRAWNDLTAREVYEWAMSDGRLDGDKNTGTVRRMITQVRACMYYLQGIGWPVKLMVIKRPPDSAPRKRHLSAEEMEQMIAACSDVIRNEVVFLFYTGARLGEMTGLTWADVTGDGKVLLWSKKGAEKKLTSREVPVHERLARVLEEQRAKVGWGELVFPDQRGKRWITGVFHYHWYKATKKAGLEDFRPHDARHTFATLINRSGRFDLQVLGELLGHSSLDTTARYRSVMMETKRDAVGVLGGARSATALVREGLALGAGRKRSGTE